MATEAQISASRQNAESSTGPRTPEGKARVARNAVKLGLFSLHDLVHPEQEAEYEALAQALWSDLLPFGALQESLVIQIIRATWRLERCARVEESLLDSLLETGLDPLQNEPAARIQSSVDRARAGAENTIRRAVADLRRLQTERQIAVEAFPEDQAPALGLTCMKQVVAALVAQNKVKSLIRHAQVREALAEPIEHSHNFLNRLPHNPGAAKQTQRAA